MVLFSFSSFTQNTNRTTFSKKAHELYKPWSLKKCNKVCKKYISQHNPGDEGMDTAYYYTALTYSLYDWWNERNNMWKFRYGIHKWQMELEPINYIDSAYKYTELYVNECGAELKIVTSNEEELFEQLYFITKVQNTELTIHKYYDGKNTPSSEELYLIHKDECNSLIMYYNKLLPWLTNLYNEWYAGPMTLIELRNDFGIRTIDEIPKLLEMVREFNQKHSESTEQELFDDLNLSSEYILGFLEKNEPEWIIPFIQEFEKHPLSIHHHKNLNFHYSKSYLNRNGTEYIESLNYWKVSEEQIDLGTFIITDSVYKSSKGELKFNINLSLDLDVPLDDSMRFIKLIESTDRYKSIKIINWDMEKKLSGSRKVNCNFEITDPIYGFDPNYEAWREREWVKIERTFYLESNRGVHSFEVVYRFQHPDM